MVTIGYTGGGAIGSICSALTSADLGCYEYPGGHGALPAQGHQQIYKDLSASGKKLSMHSSYYMSVTNPSLLNRNAQRVHEACKAIAPIGFDRLVVHAGSKKEPSRRDGLRESYKQLAVLQQIASQYGVSICAETTGKVVQIGSLSEVISLCKGIPGLIPCIDIGHVNSRTNGGCNDFTVQQWLTVLQYIEKELGEQRAHKLHFHVSRQMYNSQGEIKHMQFKDTAYGPNWENFVLALKSFGGEDIRVICESAGTQLVDAITMLETLNN